MSISDVEKTYRPRRGEPVHALAKTDFRVAKGEFISLVGPSGCGKTTLLKMIGGLISPSEGEVHLAGEAVTGPRNDVGMVFQSATLLPWRTVLENVMLPVEVQKLDKQRYRKRTMELLEMVGLAGFEDRYPKELSGGMQQRAGICRALVHDPDILLMDEPFGALDAMTRDTMNLELLRIWRESGKTIVLVTHSIPEAVFLSDRVIVISPRPGTVVDDIRINLDRPRRLEMMNTEAAGIHTSGIRRYFDMPGADA